jgi:hypothetical protein
MYSNGTEERNSKIIKIKIWFDVAELVTFIHKPGIKFGRSGSYWPLFVPVEAGRSVAWQTSSLLIVWRKRNNAKHWYWYLKLFWKVYTCTLTTKVFDSFLQKLVVWANFLRFSYPLPDKNQKVIPISVLLSCLTQFSVFRLIFKRCVKDWKVHFSLSHNLR